MDTTLTIDPHRVRRKSGHRFSAACVLPAIPASVPALRRLAEHSARRWQLPDATVEALGLIVTELATNAVRHSGSPDVTMRLCVTDGALTVQIQDSGGWRPAAVPPPGAEVGAGLGDLESTPCGGRGLLLVEAYAANCAVSAGADGTVVTAQLFFAA